MTASATTQLPARDPLLARLAQAVQRERVLVLLAFAAVGLHLADDNFLQPEPGTSAADHLVSGLLPLLLVAGAALAYGRVRAGARASLALVLGYFGVPVGMEAVYYAFAGAPSSDDYTGFLSLVCGFLLLVAGTVMLWRSRRRNDSFVRRHRGRALISLRRAGRDRSRPFPHCARLRGNAHATRGGAQGPTRRTPRRRLRDERRYPPRGLVRAVAETAPP